MWNKRMNIEPHRDDLIEGLSKIDVREILEHEVPRPQMGRPFRYSIKPGIYSCSYGGFQENRQAKPIAQSIVGDVMVKFNDGATQEVRREIREFWEAKNQFEERGLMHKRGIMLYGQPGTGKSTLIRQIAEECVREGYIVLLGKTPWGVVESVASVRKMEPHRRLMVVLEDLDEMVKGYGEQAILEFMDGYDSKANVLVLATTNDLETMSAKLKRPGRFDRKIEIGYPDFDMRREYVESKMNPKSDKSEAAYIAEKTEGMGFGHLREIVNSVYGYGREIDESIDRVKAENVSDARANLNLCKGDSIEMP